MRSVWPGNSTYWWDLKDLKSSVAALRTRLEAKGCRLKTNLRRFQLADLVHEIDLGRLNYDNCTDTELRKFVIDRGITSDPLSSKSRSGDLLLLRAADKAPVFSKFMDLPSELRARIYEIYMQDFTEPLGEAPADPPITRVSRLLRAESLPVFYSTCTFQFTIVGGTNYAWDFGFDWFTKLYTPCLAGCKLGLMRNVVLAVEGYSVLWSPGSGQPKQPKVTLRTQANLSMNPNGKQYTIECLTSLADRRWRAEIGETAMLSVLHPLMDNIVQRPGQSKLTLEDFKKIADDDDGLPNAVLEGLGRRMRS